MCVEGKAYLVAILAVMEHGTSHGNVEMYSVCLSSALHSRNFDQLPRGVLFIEAEEFLSLHFP